MELSRASRIRSNSTRARREPIRPVPAGASFDPALGEFVLPYDMVRAAADPDALLLDFLTSTYLAAAECGGWDRAALECELGAPGRVRPV